MNDRYDVVIVGGGHGGAQVAAALRQRGFEGSIALVGAEPELPYERPPLSKEYLSGEKPFERILIRPPSFWSDRKIDMILGSPVVEVSPNEKTIRVENGRSVTYGRLVWSAGGVARKLTCVGHDLVGVHAVRTRADVDRLVQELVVRPRVVIIGGGYIGLEAASALVKRGLHVTLLEAAPRLLARVAGEDLSRFYAEQHAAHGVVVRTGTTVSCVLGHERVSGVRLADGQELPAELVVVGIGIIPSVQPLLDAGADGGDGVDVDRYCLTSLQDVYAIGDCARHENSFAEGRRVRLESVQNASDMATTVAKRILGAAEPYHTVPWFWSNQYDLKLQTVGLSAGHDVAVTRGKPSANGFSVVYLKNGRVVALDCVNFTRDYVQGKRLVEEGALASSENLADVNIPLKKILSY